MDNHNTDEWRLILTGHKDAFFNMALDEAIMLEVSKGSSPITMRFYGWSPPAVSIGYFQGMEEEVDVEKCKELGIDFIRRTTGGGAVFHESEVTYSISIPISDGRVPENMLESYRVICGGVVEGLRLLGIDSAFHPLNDIIAGGRKISGSAQTRKQGTVLQHGTLLTDVNVEKMFSLLKVPDEKIRDKLIKNVKERVTSVSHQLDQSVPFEKVVSALKEGFEKQMGITLEEGDISENELKLAEDLRIEKYSMDEWNFKR